jgi:acyl-coenzyme A thioesterase PaaI-like protein
MQVKVKKKQPNSKMCFVCGLRNAFGLKSRFYELENGEIMAIFQPSSEHQGYPGRLHGGIAATILDETIGRAIMQMYSDNIWGVTVDFSMRLRKPVPLDREIRVIGRIVNDGKRTFEGTGEILLDDGTVAIEGKGKYLKMDIEKIADFDHEGEEWRVVTSPDDPEDVFLPQS